MNKLATEKVRNRHYSLGALAAMLLGSALLGGGGLGVGGALGGIAGHRLGTSAKDSLLRALRKNK